MGKYAPQRRWVAVTERRLVAANLQQARVAGDVDSGALRFGQDAGLIDSIEPAGLVVQRLVDEAEQVLRERLAGLLLTQPAHRDNR